MVIHHLSLLDVRAWPIWRAKLVRWCYWENNFGSQSEHPPPLGFAKGLSLFCHAEAWAACQWNAQSTEGFPTLNDPVSMDSHEPIPDVSTVRADTWHEHGQTTGAGRGFTLALILSFVVCLEHTFLLCISGIWDAQAKTRPPDLGCCMLCEKQDTRVISPCNIRISCDVGMVSDH